MFCSKCGNKLEDDEKFCGKCGTKNENNNKDNDERIKSILEECNSSENYERKYINQNKYQNLINIISNHKKLIIIITIIVIIPIISIALNFYRNREDAIDSVNNSYLSTSTLDVIDETNKEFKINGKQFAEELVKANKSITEKERGILIDYEVIPVENGDYINYALWNGLTTSESFLIETDKKTGNIKTIDVRWFYASEYGTEVNKTAFTQSFKVLCEALNQINQGDLADTILDMVRSKEPKRNGILALTKDDNKGGFIYFLVEQEL